LKRDVLLHCRKTAGISMRTRDLLRHFPTFAWLGRHVAAESSSLVADWKKAFPRETALSAREWCLVLVTCLPSSVVGVVLGVGFALGWPISVPNLEFAICEGTKLGLLAVLPFGIVARQSSGQVVRVIIVGNALILVSIGTAMWFFVSATAAC
jgi:hypothetical protein